MTTTTTTNYWIKNQTRTLLFDWASLICLLMSVCMCVISKHPVRVFQVIIYIYIYVCVYFSVITMVKQQSLASMQQYLVESCSSYYILTLRVWFFRSAVIFLAKRKTCRILCFWFSLCLFSVCSFVCVFSLTSFFVSREKKQKSK